MPLRSSGNDFEGPGAPILEDLSSMPSKRYHAIPFLAHHSVPCISTTFRSIRPLPYIDQPPRRIVGNEFFAAVAPTCSRDFLKGQWVHLHHSFFQLLAFQAAGLQVASAGCAKRKQCAGVPDPQRVERYFTTLPRKSPLGGALPPLEEQSSIPRGARP